MLTNHFWTKFQFYVACDIMLLYPHELHTVICKISLCKHTYTQQHNNNIHRNTNSSRSYATHLGRRKVIIRNINLQSSQKMNTGTPTGKSCVWPSNHCIALLTLLPGSTRQVTVRGCNCSVTLWTVGALPQELHLKHQEMRWWSWCIITGGGATSKIHLRLAPSGKRRASECRQRKSPTCLQPQRPRNKVLKQFSRNTS